MYTPTGLEGVGRRESSVRRSAYEFEANGILVRSLVEVSIS
jgi:hypothetical protein